MFFMLLAHVGRMTASGLLATRRHVSVGAGASLASEPELAESLPPQARLPLYSQGRYDGDQQAQAPRRTLGSAALQQTLDFRDLF